ncbi:carcinoembryonic antigen-related cell adhesion molecule 6-like [Leucoraja erinacea]|uniref:carcinoembryonic antigen-related cell adhesion molecule 6-like n=1 Tax=Leucoraja erinaceus TaxID=7782 RepID=UPI0024553B1D|nr:carcinoembryonic antigen-related cell adhesion molecule 6-like [Leucoraja erinacea]
MEIAPQSPVTRTNGEDLTLTCSAQSVPSPVYEWFNETERLSTGPVFTIPSVSMEHAGKYTCHANNAWTGRNISLTSEVIMNTAVPETRSGLTPGAIAVIVFGVTVACLLGGVGGWLIARKTSGN